MDKPKTKLEEVKREPRDKELGFMTGISRRYDMPYVGKVKQDKQKGRG